MGPNSVGLKSLFFFTRYIIMTVSKNIKSLLTFFVFSMAIAALAVSTVQAETTTITGTLGSSDSWNTLANWDNGVPSGDDNAVIAAGVTAKVDNAATPGYTGVLILQAGSTLKMEGAAGSENAVTGVSEVIMGQDSLIQINLNANFGIPAITLTGDAMIETLFGASDWQTTDFDGSVTGDYTLTLSGFNGHNFNLNAANSISELIVNAINRWNLHAKATGSLGLGDVTVNPAGDYRSATLYIDAEDAMDPSKSLFLNGGGFSGTGSDRLVLNADLTVMQLWIDGVQQNAGIYTAEDDFISSGSGILRVLDNPGEETDLLLLSGIPADDESDVQVPCELTAMFSQPVELVSGNITLRNLTDGIDTVIPVGDDRITVSGICLTVDPGRDLLWNKNYAVRIDPTAIRSDSGLGYAGITDDTTWNFTTGVGDPLFVVIQTLKDHITGAVTLTGIEIEACQQEIAGLKSRFGESAQAINACRDLIETFDNTPGFGPLFVNTGDMYRSSADNPQSFNWTIFKFMQYAFDEIFTAENLELYQAELDGFMYKSSQDFPGPVQAGAEFVSHTATINAGYPKTQGWLRQGDDLPARKPTGTYLAAGTIATVTVPQELVGKGYKVRVGAHSWDFEAKNRPPVKRLDRCTKLFDIDATTIKVANPLGGGIYIEVPYLADGGIVTVDIDNVVRSPYFSAKSFHTTTLEEWRNIERNHPGPWADFQTDKYMCQVPRTWIYNMDDPAAAMENWDLAVDTYNDLMGFPHDRGKETIYLQVDVINRSSVFAPGYPAVNIHTSNPATDSGGNVNTYLVRGPQIAPNWCLHEQGHAYFFDKFGGEMESTVNLPHVAIWNQCFGYDLDYAFAASLGFQGNPHRTLDNTAVTWMTVFSFSPKEQPMQTGEKAYQLKGHAKFVDIARLFGWQVINDYYHQLVLEGINKNTSRLSDDDRIFRLSKAAGFDLRPLFHFWGIHPRNPAALKASIEAEGLPPSAAIYNRLIHYKSLVPPDNAAFQQFALNWWGRQPRITGNWTEREHARQWDEEVLWDNQHAPNGEIYVETSCDRIKAVIDGLIEIYFPNGSPDCSVELDDIISWSGEPIALDPKIVNDTGSELSYLWISDPNEGVVFDANDVVNPVVTITKPAGEMAEYTLSLEIFKDTGPAASASMTVSVYEDSCQATRLGLGVTEKADLNQDCVINLKDLAVIAEKWFTVTGLSEPMPVPSEN